MADAFARGLDYIAHERPDYTRETEAVMSVNRALEVVSRWLERVATRDPALFRTFVAKINAAEKKAPTKPKTKAKIDDINAKAKEVAKNTETDK